MCIIVFKPQKTPVDIDTLRICFENNPDGAGYMFPCEGKLLIKKGFFTFDDLRSAWGNFLRVHGDKLPVVFHFRIATAGRIDKTNCHPHRIARDLGFVHNGILSCVKVPKHSKLSDTIIYRDRYLGNLAGKSLHNANLFESISDHIGPGNKFAFMNARGEVIICNEDQGLWEDGLWFSNTSFRDRSLPFSFFSADVMCEYCGKALETSEELVEGVCQECLAYLEADYVECGGCHNILLTNSHKAAGWCDDCGFEIYGQRWSKQLRSAAAERLSDRAFPEWF